MPPEPTERRPSVQTHRSPTGNDRRVVVIFQVFARPLLRCERSEPTRPTIQREPDDQHEPDDDHHRVLACFPSHRTNDRVDRDEQVQHRDLDRRQGCEERNDDAGDRESDPVGSTTSFVRVIAVAFSTFSHAIPSVGGVGCFLKIPRLAFRPMDPQEGLRCSESVMQTEEGVRSVPPVEGTTRRQLPSVGAATHAYGYRLP